MAHKNITVYLLGGPADGLTVRQDEGLDPVMYADWALLGEITIHQYRIHKDVGGSYYGFHQDLTDGEGYDIIYEGDQDDGSSVNWRPQFPGWN